VVSRLISLAIFIWFLGIAAWFVPYISPAGGMPFARDSAERGLVRPSLL